MTINEYLLSLGSRVFVVQHINHSLDTKRILFIPVLVQGVPCVLSDLE